MTFVCPKCFGEEVLSRRILEVRPQLFTCVAI